MSVEYKEHEILIQFQAETNYTENSFTQTTEVVMSQLSKVVWFPLNNRPLKILVIVAELLQLVKLIQNFIVSLQLLSNFRSRILIIKHVSVHIDILLKRITETV